MNKADKHLGNLGLAVLVGFSALPIIFIGGSVFEIKGTNSTRELAAAAVTGTLYLAFAQFWVSPRGSGGFRAKWLSWVATTAPAGLFLFLLGGSGIRGLLMLASVCLGSGIGAVMAGKGDRTRLTPTHSP